jgi:hypothetical protein
MWEAIYGSREWKRRGKSIAALATGVPDNQQWDIQPLGPGYTIRKVSADSITHVYPLNTDNRPGRLPLQSPTSSA